MVGEPGVIAFRAIALVGFYAMMQEYLIRGIIRVKYARYIQRR